MTKTRKALLVGSMPFGSEAASMQTAMQALGNHLIAMPDGEVGEKSEEFPSGRRQSWVHTAILANIESGAFRVLAEPAERTEDGFMKDSTTRWLIQPNYPPSELAKHLDFGYLRYFRESYVAFKKLREKAGQPDMTFQVGIPTGGAISLFSMRPLTGLRYRRAMDERLTYEVTEIVKEAGDDVIIQVEVPLEVLMVGMMPSFMMWLPVRWMTQLIERFPDGTRVGMHLCLGDLNNRSEAKLHVEKMLVQLTNRLMSRWPSGVKLEFVHFPLAEAATPPSTAPETYAPLGEVRLPEGVRFVAGFVHEGLSEDEHGAILKSIEDARGEAVDVACSCGLARRTPEVAHELLRLTDYTVNLS
ncbi:MAG: hypothetical protein DWQ07_22420 [Chloroflexi bacterium]|nr:MAG: hypothetical protein DWQ07_22420 [Chloroflexota bacterium]MBL1193904.1 hypothetical protein [Chloroflexota bacterium]NOH11198.1 hypothetical protein [Chloroflexota bacterium]